MKWSLSFSNEAPAEHKGKFVEQNDYIDLSYPQVALAAGLLFINAAISLALQLKLERRLVIAAVRMTVQLLLVGLVLHSVFGLAKWYAVVGLMLVMTWTAGVLAVSRTGVRFRGVWLSSMISVWVSSWLAAWLAILAIVRVQPWYLPQYAIPLLGMILGNSLNGVSLGLDRFGAELQKGRAQIEALLALGATRWEAARPSMAESVRTGMIPILNAMTAAGIVSLPGMMTGQMLHGAAPLEAVKYQIVIMFLIAAATGLGTVGVVVLSFYRLFNTAHQFTGSQNAN